MLIGLAVLFLLGMGEGLLYCLNGGQSVLVSTLYTNPNFLFVTVAAVMVGSRLYGTSFNKNVCRGQNPFAHALSATLVLCVVIIMLFAARFVSDTLVSLIFNTRPFYVGITTSPTLNYGDNLPIWVFFVHMLLSLFGNLSYGVVVMFFAALTRYAVIPMGGFLLYVTLSNYLFALLDLIFGKPAYSNFLAPYTVSYQAKNVHNITWNLGSWYNANLNLENSPSFTPIPYNSSLLTHYLLVVAIYFVVFFSLTVLVYATKKRRGYYN